MPIPEYEEMEVRQHLEKNPGRFVVVVFFFERRAKEDGVGTRKGKDIHDSGH